MIDYVSADVQQRITDNWRRVQDEVAAACEAADRDSNEVTIVGVTKYVDVALTLALANAGCHDLGENRPQALWQKAQSLQAEPIRWHLIGNLQRNKARRTIPLLHRLHSLDSVRLAQTISLLGLEQDFTTDCLLEVNVSGDEQKHGFDPVNVAQAMPDLLVLPNIRVLGFMCMASLKHAQQDAAIDFQALRLLRDRVMEATGAKLPELSMGMSGDFASAIDQGATHVRIGSRLYEGVI